MYHQEAQRPCRVLFAIVLVAGIILAAILIDIVLVVSFVQLPPASVPLKVAITVSGKSSIFSQRLIHDCPSGRHHHWM